MTDLELKLLGLKTLADEHSRRLEEIDRATCRLLGVAGNGHASDWIYDNRDTRTPEEIIKLASVKESA